MQETYKEWLKNATQDKEIVDELNSIKANAEEIKERFYKELSFGTGGLRGILRAGTNGINIYTVRKATQGLCNYLKANFKNPSIAIAYDSRKNSFAFAKTAAEVFVANGVAVHIFKELMPTPTLSFAVRHLKCSGGIVITASHNPAKYNGYKVYDKNGCQITLETAQAITDCINKVAIFKDILYSKIDDINTCKDINIISDTAISAYFKAVYKESVFKDSHKANLKVVYSALNGAGSKPVRRILITTGITDIIMVKEQKDPDSSFSTCPYPNPEEKEALTLGLKLAKVQNADILLATDPDCDRVGCAVKHKGEYPLINGNQMGVLLFDFICKMRTQTGTMPNIAGKKPVAVKTIVTTEMARAVADKYNVELIDVLTGFKFIGEQIALLGGEEQRYIFGFEESYGYLSGSYARDKDAVNASMLICEMASYYKLQNKTLIDVLEELYLQYGYYFDNLESFTFEGAKGMEKMAEIMDSLRDGISKLGKYEICATYDYLAGKKYIGSNVEKINLPTSDVISFQLTNGSFVVVRPSGTEPKLKVYYSLKCEKEEDAYAMFKEIAKEIQKLIV